MFQIYGHGSILEVNKFSACTSLVKLAFFVQQRLFTSFVRLKFQLKAINFNSFTSANSLVISVVLILQIFTVHVKDLQMSKQKEMQIGQCKMQTEGKIKYDIK